LFFSLRHRPARLFCLSTVTAASPACLNSNGQKTVANFAVLSPYIFINRMIIMKLVLCTLCLLAVSLAGCAKKHALDERMYTVVLQAYLSAEFRESFDDKLSMAQKQKLLVAVCGEMGVDHQDFLDYARAEKPAEFKKYSTSNGVTPCLKSFAHAICTFRWCCFSGTLSRTEHFVCAQRRRYHLQIS
jgi:hypothetical protein